MICHCKLAVRTFRRGVRDIYFIEHIRSLELRMAASGLAWMNNDTKEVVSVPAADIKWASWFRVARNFRLRVGLKDKSRRENFDGFMRDVSHNEDNLCLFAYRL